MTSVQDAPSSALLPSSIAEVEVELRKTQEALVDGIREELMCVICGSIFIDPRILQCQHCFCLRCLYTTVSRDRTSKIEIPCPYRCAAVTVTQGDIRTVPKNHYITNTCEVLRHQLVRRSRLLERKLSLSEAAHNAVHTPVAETSRDSVTLPLTPDATSPVIPGPSLSQDHPVSATPAILRKEIDAAKELHECEWCSCSSPTCEVCTYCWSRVCAECRGQFSDHQYLCVDLHQPGRRPTEGWLPGASTTTVADTGRGTGAGQEREMTTTHSTSSVSQMGVAAEAAEQASGQEAPFPYFITPFFVPVLVKECLVKQHGAALQLSEIDVTAVTAVRLSVPEVEVHCQHHTTGFGFDFHVHPSFKTTEGVEVDLTVPHWADGGGRPNATLSFLANTARLSETVLQDLRQLSKTVSEVVMELSSAARQVYVRRNKGFHMYAVHVWSLARAQCIIARDALLPHLERSRLLENIMGDLVVYQFQQTASHASPPQKHVIRGKCVAFMKAEVQLCRQLDQVMEGIDAACRGIHTLLARMYTVMKELAQPKVHRGVDQRRSRQSRLRFSMRMFSSRQQEQQDSCKHDSHYTTTSADGTTPSSHTCAGVMRSLSRRSLRAGMVSVEGGTPPSLLPGSVEDTLSDTVPSDSPTEPDCSFRGQVAEHGLMTRTLTESMLSILRCFMQARIWEWSLSNTCIRECGLSEVDRRTLLAAEEELQLITDDLLHSIWSHSRMTYILEAGQDAAGPASSLDILMDHDTLELLNSALKCHVYDHSEVFESLRDLSKLRAQFVASSSGVTIMARNPETQQELLSMMSSVLSTTMAHQTTALRLVTQASTSLDELYARYLRMRQMDPTVGERPSPSEDTLLAVDMLKMLQHQSGEKLSNYLAVISERMDHHHSGRARDSRAGQGFLRAVTVAMTQDSRMSHASHASFKEDAGATSSCPFIVDFSLRDTALSSCQAFGEALVRAAHGEHLQAGAVPERHQEEQQSVEQAIDAAGAVEEASERVSPPAVAVERSTMSIERTVSGRSEETASRTLLSPSISFPAVDVETQGNTLALSAETTAAASFSHDEDHSSVRDDDEAVREPLFAADADASVVPLAPVLPSATDGDGIRKAAKLFGAAFQLSATSTSVGRRRVRLLPFYRGECAYKGVSTPFYVDGQTGTVLIDPRTLSAAGKRQYALELLSSPLFFILLNSTLSIFLHRRYKLEIMYT
ncbi:hypothetical protein, unknown function [Leishmania tarentolae]|uniref:RING-type domain-containing protein n=1 Tax=Leishmania tarentolae TaxID=5689 RepID=A0A640KN85_LEITA|nr:hypothetical protein, unknown function [Leishmania tarentolae]